MSKRPEDMLQKACIKWIDQHFAMKHPHLMIELENKKKEPYKVAPIFYTKNEGNKSIGAAMEDRRMGLRAGVCDLQMHVNNCDSFGLMTELKSRNGYTKKNQRAWHAFWVSQGFEVHTNIRTLKEFIKIVMAYMANVKGLEYDTKENGITNG